VDTLTHALSGALAARATEPIAPRPDQLPRRTRMWIGFWAAAFPDSDFIVQLIDPLLYLTTHRGVTHSVVMLPVWAAGLALAFAWILRRRYPWRAFVGVVALGIAAHILGDVITAFGTMVLAPLTDWRLQLPTTFIIDPYFTSILIGGLVASAWWKNARTPAVAALAVLGAYVGLQAVLHQRALAFGEQVAARDRLDGTTVSAIPQPFSPFHWLVVLEDARRYRLAYIDLLGLKPGTLPPDAGWLRRVAASYRPTESAAWMTVPRFGTNPEQVGVAEEVWNSSGLARYRRFALFPAVFRTDLGAPRTCVWFNDLRFALVGRDMPFRFGGCREAPGAPWRVYRLSNGADGRDVVDAVRVLE